MPSSRITGISPDLQELLKLEHLVSSTGFSLLPKQPVHSVLAGKHSSKLRGRGLDFEEVRKYVAGDDIRNIDWRVTARTRQTYTKVFTEEKEKPVLVVTDMSPGMFFGSEKLTKSYAACQLAALSAFRVLKNGDRFGGLVFTDSDYEVVSPQRSRKAVMRYLKILVAQGESLRENPGIVRNKADILESALRRTMSLAAHDYLVLIISDFHDVNETAVRHLHMLSRHNDVILAKISDPLEAKLPPERLVLSDGELQLLWDPGRKAAYEKYEHHYHERETGFIRDMEQHGIPLLHLNTSDEVVDQLRALFSSKLKVRKS